MTLPKNAKKTGRTLKNYLKQPKSQKNAIYDQFYSDIDYQIFSTSKSTNSEQKSKNETTRKKPRRFSQAFLNQERVKLYKIRAKLRLTKTTEKENLTNYKIGSRIDAVLFLANKSQKLGIYSGTIIGIDEINHRYKIQFDSKSVGVQTIDDIDLRLILLDGQNIDESHGHDHDHDQDSSEINNYFDENLEKMMKDCQNKVKDLTENFVLTTESEELVRSLSKKLRKGRYDYFRNCDNLLPNETAGQ